MRNVSGLEVTFMESLLVYSGTTAISFLVITFPAIVLYLPFDGLVCMFHYVVMNFNILVTGLYSHKLQAILLVNF